MFRVMPNLMLLKGALVKTVNFKAPEYVGDPVNAVRIFNKKCVDELILMDIGGHFNGIDFKLVQQIAEECFMPLSYGGGIKTRQDAERLILNGVEKVILNTYSFDFDLIFEIAENLGAQCISVSVDVKEVSPNNYFVYRYGGREAVEKLDIFLTYLESLPIGEVIIHDIDRDGTWKGINRSLIKKFLSIPIPLVIAGGAKSFRDIELAYDLNVSIALGNMSVYQKKGCGVLIRFPDMNLIDQLRGFK